MCADGSTQYSYRESINDFSKIEVAGKAIMSLNCESLGPSGANICVCTPSRICYRGNNTGMSILLASYCTKGFSIPLIIIYKFLSK